MDKSTNIAEASGRECSKQMSDDKPPLIFFAVDNSHYVVYAKIENRLNPRHLPRRWKTWCFVVQEYDPSEWSDSLMKRLQRDRLKLIDWLNLGICCGIAMARLKPANTFRNNRYK